MMNIIEVQLDSITTMLINTTNISAVSVFNDNCYISLVDGKTYKIDTPYNDVKKMLLQPKYDA